MIPYWSQTVKILAQYLNKNQRLYLKQSRAKQNQIISSGKSHVKQLYIQKPSDDANSSS